MVTLDFLERCHPDRGRNCQSPGSSSTTSTPATAGNRHAAGSRSRELLCSCGLLTPAHASYWQASTGSQRARKHSGSGWDSL